MIDGGPEQAGAEEDRGPREEEAGGAGVSARRQTAERGMESGVYLDLYELWGMVMADGDGGCECT